MIVEFVRFNNTHLNPMDALVTFSLEFVAKVTEHTVAHVVQREPEELRAFGRATSH